MTDFHMKETPQGSVPAHRILDDLSEIIADCELLLPMMLPVYSASKHVRNIQQLAHQLAEDVVNRQPGPTD